VISSGITEKQFTTSGAQNIAAGQSYKFKVKARTAIGMSQYSKEIEIVSASTPSDLTSV
jgi:hypothetical protein